MHDKNISAVITAASSTVRVHASRNLDLVELAIVDHLGGGGFASALLTRVELRELSRTLARILWPDGHQPVEAPRAEVRRLKAAGGAQ